MTDTFNIFLPLSKVERQKDGSVTVSGYASTPALDLDGERVSLDAIKAALPGYWQWRNVREMHRPSAVGVAQEANIDSKGLFLTAKITDKTAAQKCLDGVYKGYSVGGKKLAKNGNVITEIDLVEISVVDRPANPECSINVAKSASANAEAYLLRAKPEKQLAKAVASAVSEFLVEKVGPPAAHDGFSLPAGPIRSNSAGELCKKHGVAGCEKCAMKRARKAAAIEKREFTTAMRTSAAHSGAAMPDGSYPIENTKDLHNAIQAIGRAKDPDATRRHIRRRAKALGATGALPETWTKSGRASLRARAAIVRDAADRFDLRKSATASAEPSFLTLKAGGDGREVAEGEGWGHPAFGSVTRPQESGALSAKMLRKLFGKSFSEDVLMADNTKTADASVDTLGEMLLTLAKAGRVPTRGQHMAIAAGNMKKARKARGMARDLISSLHKMHRDAYLAKAAVIEKRAKGEKADDPGEFDHQGAMEKLQKAHGALESAKTFDKAAKEHLAKAASGVARAGQRGQEAADGEGRFYTVPQGVKDLTPGEMATLSPGGDESGSFPPVLDMETVFPGKAAKKGAQGVDLSRYIPREQAELLAKNAALEAENKLLARAPIDDGRRKPYAFNVAKMVESNGGGGAGFDAELTKGLDLRTLGTKDENGHPSDEHTKTAGAIVGRMIMSGRFGKNVFDPQFHGTGPLGAAN